MSKRKKKKNHRAIVIGTGFGGAVSACRLAQAGFAVQVLERGRRYDTKGAPGFPREIFDAWVWPANRGLFEIMAISEMQVVQSAGYGGGSLIYANVHLRLPSEAFAGWPRGYSREALDPYYDLVAHMLDIRPITDSPRGAPPKALLFSAAAEALGRRAQLFHPPLAVDFSREEGFHSNRHQVEQQACNHCGECIIGCPRRAKNTLDLNYLALAERAGARMLTEHEALRIERRSSDEGAVYRVWYRDLRADEGEQFLEAEQVLLCAGAIHSTELLLRSRDLGSLPALSPQLGARYSGNGDLLTFAFKTEEPFEPGNGPSITTALLHDERQPGKLGWFLIQEGGFPSQLWPLVALSKPTMSWISGHPEEGSRSLDKVGETGLESYVPEAAAPEEGPTVAEISEAYREAAGSQTTERGLEGFFFGEGEMKHTAVFLAMGRDLSNGRIELDAFGSIRLRWDVEPNRPLYDLEERLARDIARQMKGRYATTPFWRFARLPTTVHNLGGCPMGDDVSQGVTNEWGEVFNYPGLFVMDGAILPAATGVNPSHTIAAVAERNIEQLIRRVTGNASWAPPERANTKPFADPLS